MNPGRVFAHAGYDRSDPEQDVVLSAPPGRVDVWFTEDVFKQEGRNFVRVFNDQGQQVSEGDGVVDDDDRTHISTTLQPDLPEGRYIIRWMTTSDEDGDTDEGAFCFYVVVGPSPEQQAECAAFAEEEDETPTEGAAPDTPTEPAAETPTEVAPEDTDDENDDGAPVAAIVGAVIGVVAVVIVVAGGGLLLVRRRRA